MEEHTSIVLRAVERCLTGKRYDARNLGSVAYALRDQASLRGVYRLTFANGEMYAGQSTNVAARINAHRRRWDDVVSFEYFPIPEGDLTCAERALIQETEALSPVRNVIGTQQPRGRDTWSFESEDGQASLLPWDRGKRTRPQDGVVSPSIVEFAKLAKHPAYPLIREIAGWYLSEMVSDPFGTQRYLWVVSCLPSTGATKAARRLLTLSCGNLETFVVWEAFEGKDSWIGVRINTEEVHIPDQGADEWWIEPASYRLTNVSAWLFDCEELYAYAVLKSKPFTKMELLKESGYHLTTRLMRGGSTMFRRFHNEALATDLLNASLQSY